MGNLWMFACLSTHVTLIRNFGAQYSFDATAKYRHWLKRGDIILLRTDIILLRTDVILLHIDITLLHTDVTLLPINTCMQQHYVMVSHVCTDLYRLHSDSAVLLQSKFGNIPLLTHFLRQRFL